MTFIIHTLFEDKLLFIFSAIGVNLSIQIKIFYYRLLKVAIYIIAIFIKENQSLASSRTFYLFLFENMDYVLLRLYDTMLMQQSCICYQLFRNVRALALYFNYLRMQVLRLQLRLQSNAGIWVKFENIHIKGRAHFHENLSHAPHKG